jgi:O-antigen ligase
VEFGSLSAHAVLSDFAVLAVAVVALVAGVRHGFEPLRAGWPVWVAGGLFCLLVGAASLYPRIWDDAYDVSTHAVTAAKFGEYALLALAAPLAIRTLEELTPLLLALVAWSAAATFGAVLQFLGLWNEFEGRRPGQREPSFLGVHDLAALSGAALSLGLIAIALGRYRRLGLAGGISGGLGMMLSGATTAVSGMAAAALAAWFLGRRRALALAAVVAVVGAGVISIRAFDTRPLLDALGIEHSRTPETNPEASWQQRFALAYIGGRIFLDNPLLGVGWQASEEAVNYEPYVDDARRRFPDLPERALPSPEHPWGVQNGYVQAAADLGVLGLVAFLALFIVPLRVAWRAGADGAVPILWLLVSMGVWIGLGLVAGIPLVGLTWLSIGLAAASASWRG